MADRSESVIYREDKYSPAAIRSAVMGGISLLIFLAEAGISLIIEGNVGPWAGALGITGFLVAFAGMIIGLRSFHDICRSILMAKVWTLLSGILVAIWFLVFCAGIA